MAYSDAVNAEASLQSYWRLNDSGATADDSKSTIDGTYDGLVSKQQPGLLPNDGDFGIVTSRGDAAGVEFGDNYEFTGTANFTIEVWVKPTAVDGTVEVIANKWDNGAGGWVLDHWNGGTRFRRYDSGGVDDACTASALAQGTTQYLVVTYDGSDIKIYINNGAPTTQASTRSIAATTNPLALGKYGGGGSGFSGTLDEFAIYNAALTSTDVSDHYAAAQAEAPSLRTIRSGLRW